MLNCTPISAFNDNYIWAIQRAQASKHVVLVDPGDAKPALDFLKKHNLNLIAILITHHHHDHVGGISELLKHYQVPVYGPKSIDGVTDPVEDNACFTISAINLEFRVLSIPGHTLEHIAYYHPDALFCGDTLFAGGCGRVFEGTPEQMLNSLEKLAALPEATKVFCAHEYTLNNLRFAEQVEPDNRAIQQRIINTQKLLADSGCSLPSTLALEKQTNPFLRCDQRTIIEMASAHANQNLIDKAAVFTAVRAWKNHF